MAEAEWVETLARRYGVLPSQIYKEDATLMQHLAILERGGGFDGE